MSQEIIDETLQAAPLFSGLTAETVEKLAAHLERKPFKAGDVVFAEGDPADALFVVHKGAVWVSKGSGESVVVLGKGAHFGEIGILLEAPRTATVTAGEDSELLVLTVEAADRVLLDAPYAAALFFRALAESLADRLRTTTDEYTWLRSRLR